MIDLGGKQTIIRREMVRVMLLTLSCRGKNHVAPLCWLMMLVCLTKTLMSLLSHSFVEETDVRETIRERVTEPDAEHARMKARNGHAYFGGWKAGILYFFVKWIAACPLFLWFIITICCYVLLLLVLVEAAMGSSDAENRLPSDLHVV